MNQLQSKCERIPLVEIGSVDDETAFASGQLQNMIIYQNSSNYHLTTGIETIKTAILDAITHFGSNYRHPLLFNVQVVPGDEIDAVIASVPRGDRRQRRKL